MGNVLKAGKHEPCSIENKFLFRRIHPKTILCFNENIYLCFIFSPFSLMQMDILAMSIPQLVMTKLFFL